MSGLNRGKNVGFYRGKRNIRFDISVVSFNELHHMTYCFFCLFQSTKSIKDTSKHSISNCRGTVTSIHHVERQVDISWDFKHDWYWPVLVHCVSYRDNIWPFYTGYKQTVRYCMSTYLDISSLWGADDHVCDGMQNVGCLHSTKMDAARQKIGELLCSDFVMAS